MVAMSEPPAVLEVSENSLGARLRSLRRQLDLSQQELAAQLGIPASTVNRWEMGHSMPSYKHLLGIYRFAADKNVDPRLFPIAGFQGQGLQGLATSGALVSQGVILTLRTTSGPGVLAKVLGAIAGVDAEVLSLMAKQLSDSSGIVEVQVDLERSNTTLGALFDALHETGVVCDARYLTESAASMPVAV